MTTVGQCVEFLKEKGLHSPILTSSFQRNFGISYIEAVNLMDELVEKGYISEYYPKKRLRYVLKIN
ncbi:DNA translocase FtsK [Bacillus infantis]|uniref:DNA translocase FtsK n=1 Tax=Bacillus infantis TaxID=324767 RepID=UPI003CFA0B94